MKIVYPFKYLLLLVVFSLQESSLFTTSSVQASVIISKSNVTLHFIQTTLNALDRTMAFFRREHHNVNLDSVIGTRMVEAATNVILNRLQTSGMDNLVPLHILDHIARLRDESSEISNITVPFIRLNQPNYFAKIGPILRAGLFQLDYDSREVDNEDIIWPYNQHDTMQEDDSDGCLSELFGIKTGVKCDISEKCWKRMTSYNNNGYTLSHEIFYLEIAEGSGCREQIDSMAQRHGQPPVDVLQYVFCANMLTEAHLFAKEDFPMRHHDLFMEQAALCGILGYRGFFRFDWLAAILSWQDESDGCFKWMGWPKEVHGQNYNPSSHHRGKREEQRVSHECLCHLTSVASGALIQYVRYMLETYLEQKAEETL